MADKLSRLPMSKLSELLGGASGPLNSVTQMAQTTFGLVYARAMSVAPVSAPTVGPAVPSSTSPALSPENMARLESLASVHRAGELGKLNGASIAQLQTMVDSTNLAMPQVLSALDQFLAPIAQGLDKLLATLAALSGIQSMTGRNLLLPGTAFSMPSVGGAGAVPGLSLPGIAPAAADTDSGALGDTGPSTDQALPNLMMAMRVQSATMAMGYSMPAGAGPFNSALRLTKQIAPLQTPSALMQEVAAKVRALAQAMDAIGTGLLAPGAPEGLQAALETAQANLQATLEGGAESPADMQPLPTADVGNALAANSFVSENADSIVSAAAGLDVAEVPDLQSMAQAMALTADLESISGTSAMSSSPCSSCSFKF